MYGTKNINFLFVSPSVVIIFCNIRSVYNITCFLFRYPHFVTSSLFNAFTVFKRQLCILYVVCAVQYLALGLLIQHLNKLQPNSTKLNYIIPFMCSIYNYIPETRHVSTVYSVAAVLYLQSVLHVMLFRPLQYVLYLYISTPAVYVQCPIWLLSAVP